MNKKIMNYQAADTLGRSSVELVVKVYDGAISSLKQAAEAYTSNDFARGYELIEKAKRFIVHLYTTLDEDKGQDIARNLSQLYAYVIEKMNIVQATKDLDIIEESISVLSNVRMGWEQLEQSAAQEMENADHKDRPACVSKGLDIFPSRYAALVPHQRFHRLQGEPAGVA